MKRILMIIGAGILQAPAIKIAREMGLETLVTDYNKNAYGMKFADFPTVMSHQGRGRDGQGSQTVLTEQKNRRGDHCRH